jgi:hypothetical protein
LCTSGGNYAEIGEKRKVHLARKTKKAAPLTARLFVTSILLRFNYMFGGLLRQGNS